jgi:2-methylfumaryl-CoA isomerase
MHDRRGDVVMGPLSGLRIIESSAFVAVPFAGMTMAQMGADVIRIDLLKGGMDARRWPVTASGESLFWAGMNKGKRSLAINFATPEGAEIVAALITAPGPDAGIFMTNLRGRGALDYPALAATRPDLIMVSLTGTRRGEPAVDYTVNPALGFPMATGLPGTDPVAHVLPAWDLIAGQMIVNTLLGAERHRLRTGAGQLAELSLKDVAAGVMGHLGIIGEVAVNGVDRGRYGNSLYGAYGQDFVLADGQRVMVIGLTDRQWKGLVRTLEMEAAMAELATRLALDLTLEAHRWQARAEITALFQPWFAARTLAEIAPLFDAAGLTWSVFRSFAGAVQHDPDLSPDNPMFTSLHQPGIGTYPVPGSPVASTAYARSEPRPAPRLGAHSEQILAEVLGLPSGAIAGLIDRKIIAPASA